VTLQKKGKCYSSSECASKKGTVDGNCAEGLGVCCTFDSSVTVVYMGEPTINAEVPWQAILEDTNCGTLCGSTIINHRYLLTAAHCIDSFKQKSEDFCPEKKSRKNTPYPANILIILGQPNYCEGSKTEIAGYRKVRRVHVHPTYRAKQGKGKENMPIYDFALIEVRRSFKFGEKIRPICLPGRNDWKTRTKKYTGEITTVTGYGRTEKIEIEGRDQTSCQLLKADLQVMPFENETCFKMSAHPYVQLCGYHEKRDSCEGDSGGAMSVERTIGNIIRHYLIGVVSYGNPVCGSTGFSSVYGRVTKVMPWIVARIQRGECGNRRRQK